jgi:hypothetical protein
MWIHVRCQRVPVREAVASNFALEVLQVWHIKKCLTTHVTLLGFVASVNFTVSL